MNEITGASPASTSVLVGLSRLEAKLDVAIAHHGAKIETHDAALDDHEARLRAVEAKPTVSPRTLWTVGLGALGGLTGLFPVFQALYSR